MENKKKELWREIKELRKQIKEHPIGSTGLQIKLIKLEDLHKEYVRAEKEFNN
jgi:hypothetical protein